MTQYYAVLDRDDRDTARNVFVVDDAVDPVAMVVYDHGARRWVQNTALIEFVAGSRAEECAEIERAQAEELLGAWGTQLPADDEIRALARADRGA